MSGSLSSVQSRQLAIVLLVGGLLFLATLLAIPLMLFHAHYDEPLQDMSQYFSRYQGVIESKDEVRAALDQIRRQNGDQYFLRNEVAAIAASEVQQASQDVIESSGGKINRIQVEPVREEGGYHRVGVNVQLECDMTALRKILYGIETRQPYLFVDNMSIRSRQYRGRRGIASQLTSGVEPTLTVQIDVSGYAKLVDGS